MAIADHEPHLPADETPVAALVTTDVVPDGRGTEIDKVVIELDYAIIEHFSKHLYGSPNKALEELVSNSFDAYATKVYVYVPGSFTTDSILVWDDGDSMNADDLHRLWWIAQSPKAAEPERLATRDGHPDRALIGKFGIGKLASYAVGHRITHLCKRDGRFLRVTVDYRRVPHLTEEARRERKSPRHVVSLVELSEPEAIAYVQSLRTRALLPESEIWLDPHWTLAVIDELKDDVHITDGRLAWVLGNGMPLRPDFSVWLNSKPVRPKLAGATVGKWSAAEVRVRQRINAEWARSKAEGQVSGDVAYEDGAGTAPAAVVFPSLGKVTATVLLFGETLKKAGHDDEDRSYGFFVLVRERLINPDDAQFLLADPSFGTFYRSQFVIHADGLDEDLLADRERLSRGSPRVRELEVLQRALYLEARQFFDAFDTEQIHERSTTSLLPADSREHFIEPLTAYMLRHDESASPVEPNMVTVKRLSLAASDPAASFDASISQFNVNASHPLLFAAAERLGGGTKAREANRLLDLFAVGDRLLEGFLYDLGIKDSQIDQILDWRDGLLRAMAQRYARVPDALVSTLVESSYKGHREFEDALAEIFSDMGFVAQRDGASGNKDVLVIAPIGVGAVRFTVEGKGNKDAVEVDEADIDLANVHRKDVGASVAIVVAREFAGFKLKDHPRVLDCCDVQWNDAGTEGVAIATVAVIASLHEAIRKYHYPLSIIVPVLSVVESPAEKLQRVQALEHPEADFDLRKLLDAIWENQQGQGSGDYVLYRQLWQGEPEWRTLEFDTVFEPRVVALQALSRGLVVVNTSRQWVNMLQSPQHVAEEIARSLGGEA